MARNRKRAKERRARRPQAVAYRSEREDPRGALDEAEDRPELDEVEDRPELEEVEDRPELAELDHDGPPVRDDRDQVGALDHDDALDDRVDRDELAGRGHDDALAEHVDRVALTGVEPGPGDEEETPGPLVHAAPDAELADAQLVLGRSELDRESGALQEDPAPPEVEHDSEVELENEDETRLGDDDEAEVEDEYDVGAEGEADEHEMEDEALGLAAAGRRSREAGFQGEPAPGRRGELAAPAAAIPQRRPLSGNRVINFLQGSWRELQRVQWPDRRQVMQATGVVIGFVIVAGVFLGVADFLAGKLVDFILK